MVALDVIQASNARLRELGPGLVALFGTVYPCRLASELTKLISSSWWHKWNWRIHPQGFRPKYRVSASLPGRTQCYSRRPDYKRMRGIEQGGESGVFEGGCHRAQRG